MFHEPGTTVVHKRLSFLSTCAIGATAVTVTLITCVSGIAVYGLRLADKKSDSLIGFIQEATTNLPELQRALPPALADAINDERSPAYAGVLGVNCRLAQREGRGRWSSAVVEVENKGDQIVSMMSLRLVGLDDSGDPTVEKNVWISTPIQAGSEWRGPLLPHETRRVVVWGLDRESVKSLVHEITDIRVWRGDQPPEADDESATSHRPDPAARKTLAASHGRAARSRMARLDD